MPKILTKEQVNDAFRLWLTDWIDSKKITQLDAANFFDISPGTLNHILSGKRNASDTSKEKMMAKAGKKFTDGLTPYVMDIYDANVNRQLRIGAGSDGPLTDEEIVEERIRRAEEVLEIAAFEATVGDRFPGAKNIPLRPVKIPEAFESNASSVVIPLVKVPLFDAGAGEPCEFRDDWRTYDMDDDADFVYVTAHEAAMGAFGIKVNGDSMAPTVEKGDTVIVMPTRYIENGKIVFACWPSSDGDAGKRLIKRYKADDKGNIVLWSDNPTSEPIILDKKADRDVRLFRVTKLVKDL